MSIERVLNKESGEGESAPGGQAETLRADRSRSGRLPGWVTEREGLPGAELVAPFALPLLRILMGVVFIWFGALKVIGESPVSKLVAGTLPWIDPGVVVPALGGLEVLLGIGLILGVGLRLVLPFAAAHLTGTFLTFVMLPGMMFRDDDPLLVTADGEFVLKNLVLISACLVLIAHGSSVRWARTGSPEVAQTRVPSDPSV